MAEWSGGEKKEDAQIRTPAPLPLRVFRFLVMAACFSIIMTTFPLSARHSKGRASTFDFILDISMLELDGASVK